MNKKKWIILICVVLLVAAVAVTVALLARPINIVGAWEVPRGTAVFNGGEVTFNEDKTFEFIVDLGVTSSKYLGNYSVDGNTITMYVTQTAFSSDDKNWSTPRSFNSKYSAVFNKEGYIRLDGESFYRREADGT